MPLQLSWLEHLTLNQGVLGSSPRRGTMGQGIAQVHKYTQWREHRPINRGLDFLRQLVRLKIGNAAKPGVFDLYVLVAQMEQSIGFLIRWPGVRVPSGIPTGSKVTVPLITSNVDEVKATMAHTANPIRVQLNGKSKRLRTVRQGFDSLNPYQARIAQRKSTGFQIQRRGFNSHSAKHSKGNMLLWLSKHSQKRAITERSPGQLLGWQMAPSAEILEGFVRPL